MRRPGGKSRLPAALALLHLHAIGALTHGQVAERLPEPDAPKRPTVDDIDKILAAQAKRDRRKAKRARRP